MGQDPLGGGDEVRPTRVVGEQGNDERGGIGEGDACGEGRPAGEGRALQAEEEEDTAKEALTAAALAEFVFGLGGGQAGAVLGALGIPGHHGGGPQGGVDPVDKGRAPVVNIPNNVVVG